MNEATVIRVSMSGRIQRVNVSLDIDTTIYPVITLISTVQSAIFWLRWVSVSPIVAFLPVSAKMSCILTRP